MDSNELKWQLCGMNGFAEGTPNIILWPLSCFSVELLTVKVGVSMTLSSDFRILSLLLGCLYKPWYKGFCLFFIVSCLVLFGCCLGEPITFLRRQNCRETDREVDVGALEVGTEGGTEWQKETCGPDVLHEWRNQFQFKISKRMVRFSRKCFLRIRTQNLCTSDGQDNRRWQQNLVV